MSEVKLDKHPDVRVKRLLEVVARKDVDLLRILLDDISASTSPKERDELLLPVLGEAARNEEAKMCRILLDAMDDFQKAYDDNSNIHPLHATNSRKVLELFVEKLGPDVLNLFDEDIDGMYMLGPRRATPLLRAAIDGDIEKCRILLELGADPDLIDPDCFSASFEDHDAEEAFRPLHAAVVNNNEDLIRLLLHHGAELDPFSVKLCLDQCGVHEENNYEKSRRILHLLFSTNKDAFQNFLVDAIEANGLQDVQRMVRSEIPIDFNKKTKDGLTPFRWAMKNNAVEIAELLLSHGADPFAKSKNRRSDFEVALMDESKRDFLKLLLPKWTEKYPTGKNENGDVMLHVLCKTPASLETIHFVCNRRNTLSNEVKEPDGTYGLLPVFIAAIENLALEIVYIMLRSYPEAVIGTDGNPIPLKALEIDSNGKEGGRKRAAEDTTSGNSNKAAKKES